MHDCHDSDIWKDTYNNHPKLLPKFQAFYTFSVVMKATETDRNTHTHTHTHTHFIVQVVPTAMKQ